MPYFKVSSDSLRKREGEEGQVDEEKEIHTRPQRSDTENFLRYSAQRASLASPKHGHKRNPLDFPPGLPVWKIQVLRARAPAVDRVTPTAVRKAPSSSHKHSRFQRAWELLLSTGPLSSSLTSFSPARWDTSGEPTNLQGCTSVALLICMFTAFLAEF